MKGNIRMGRNMELASIFGVMGLVMRGIGQIIRYVAMEYTLGLMGEYLL